MEFGIFDHVDRSDAALPDYYESRLRLVEPTTAAVSIAIT